MESEIAWHPPGELPSRLPDCTGGPPFWGASGVYQRLGASEEKEHQYDGQDKTDALVFGKSWMMATIGHQSHPEDRRELSTKLWDTELSLSIQMASGIDGEDVIRGGYFTFEGICSLVSPCLQACFGANVNKIDELKKVLQAYTTLIDHTYRAPTTLPGKSLTIGTINSMIHSTIEKHQWSSANFVLGRSFFEKQINSNLKSTWTIEVEKKAKLEVSVGRLLQAFAEDTIIPEASSQVEAWHYVYKPLFEGLIGNVAFVPNTEDDAAIKETITAYLSVDGTLDEQATIENIRNLACDLVLVVQEIRGIKKVLENLSGSTQAQEDQKSTKYSLKNYTKLLSQALTAESEWLGERSFEQEMLCQPSFWKRDSISDEKMISMHKKHSGKAFGKDDVPMDCFYLPCPSCNDASVKVIPQNVLNHLRTNGILKTVVMSYNGRAYRICDAATIDDPLFRAMSQFRDQKRHVVRCMGKRKRGLGRCVKEEHDINAGNGSGQKRKRYTTCTFCAVDENELPQLYQAPQRIKASDTKDEKQKKVLEDLLKISKLRQHARKVLADYENCP